MSKESLLTLINSGESEHIEFKQTFDKETIETVVAFANTQGGHVFILDAQVFSYN